MGAMFRLSRSAQSEHAVWPRSSAPTSPPETVWLAGVRECFGAVAFTSSDLGEICLGLREDGGDSGRPGWQPSPPTCRLPRPYFPPPKVEKQGCPGLPRSLNYTEAGHQDCS